MAPMNDRSQVRARVFASAVLLVLVSGCSSESRPTTFDELSPTAQEQVRTAMQFCDTNDGGYHIDRSCFDPRVSGVSQRAVDDALRRAESEGQSFVYADEEPSTEAPTATPCGGASQRPLDQPVTLSVSVERTPEGVILTGKTNLPECTELSLEVTGEGYMGQSKAFVQGGSYRSEDAFSDRGSPFAPGNYEAQVLMPVPVVQPPGVRAVIGENGEHLSGPLVHKEDMGIVVENTTSFSV